ncbi:MAG: TPM domain-containing protein [Acutalibacteraceae bacterium]
MKKRIRCLLLVFLFCLVLCVSAAAAEQTGAQLSYVTDAAGLLSENETMLLEKMAESVSKKYGVGVYIVTVEDYRDFHSEGVYKATYTIYHECTMGEGPNRDGIMLLLSMDDRDWAMFCYGSRCEYAFNSYGQQKLEKVFLDNFGENDWYGGFEDYVKECSVYLEKASAGKPVRASLFYPLLIVIGLSLLAAAAVVAVIWQKMDTVSKKQPRTPTSPRDSGLRSKQIILPIRQPPAGRSSAAPPAAEAVTANPAAAVPAEAENFERSGYENNPQTSIRAVAGAGSVAVALRLCTEDANRA